jgi:hypothetical protein
LLVIVPLVALFALGLVAVLRRAAPARGPATATAAATVGVGMENS